MMVEDVVLKNNYFENKIDVKYRFFNIATYFNRPGPSITSYMDFSITTGKVDKIMINREYNYPTTNEQEYLVIPRTTIVIIECVAYDEIEDDHEETWYEVFHHKMGWVSFNTFDEVQEFMDKHCTEPIRELNGDDLKAILSEIQKNDDFKEERKWILEISEWKRPGPSFDDEQYFEIHLGKVTMIKIKHKYDYPTTNITEYFIIPRKAFPVIVVHGSYNYGEQNGCAKWQKIIALTVDGWKELVQYDY